MDYGLKRFTLQELKNMDILCFKLLEKGTQVKLDSIFFGCALKYILLGQAGVKGQGDKNEAIVARYRKDNPFGINRIKKYIEYFDNKNLIIQENKGFYEVRRRSSLLNPLTCFFLKNDDFSAEVSNITDFEIHNIEKECTLEFKLFEAFKSNKSDPLKTSDFTFVNYNNGKMIYEKVISGLKKLGVKKQNIKIKNIDYSRSGFAEWECPEYMKYGLDVDFPYELFYKDEEFGYQNEWRIVVNDENWNFKIKYYYNEMLKVFYKSIEQLNKYINIRSNDEFRIEKDIEITQKGILLKIIMPLRAVV